MITDWGKGGLFSLDLKEGQSVFAKQPEVGRVGYFIHGTNRRNNI